MNKLATDLYTIHEAFQAFRMVEVDTDIRDKLYAGENALSRVADTVMRINHCAKVILEKEDCNGV